MESSCAANGCAESILQIVLFTILCFKWSVKKHCVTKSLQETWEISLHEIKTYSELFSEENFFGEHLFFNLSGSH